MKTWLDEKFRRLLIFLLACMDACVFRDGYSGYQSNHACMHFVAHKLTRFVLVFIILKKGVNLLWPSHDHVRVILSHRLSVFYLNLDNFSSVNIIHCVIGIVLQRKLLCMFAINVVRFFIVQRFVHSICHFS